MVLLSLVALVDVLTAFLQPRQPLPADEGTGAHIFQLAIAAMGAFGLLFLATADWDPPSRAARPILAAGVSATMAFVALYYLEHFYLY